MNEGIHLDLDTWIVPKAKAQHQTQKGKENLK